MLALLIYHDNVKYNYPMLNDFTAPVTANTGLIAGIIVALLVILIVVLLIIYLVISNRRRGSATTSASPESAGMPALFPSCCGDKTVKSKELKEEWVI